MWSQVGYGQPIISVELYDHTGRAGTCPQGLILQHHPSTPLVTSQNLLPLQTMVSLLIFKYEDLDNMEHLVVSQNMALYEFLESKYFHQIRVKLVKYILLSNF